MMKVEIVPHIRLMLVCWLSNDEECKDANVCTVLGSSYKGQLSIRIRNEKILYIF